MAVILTDMDMPINCFACEFGKRLDNERCFCERKPMEPPVADFEEKPEWCPLEQVH